jgi:Cu2+-exporting ATPase
MSALPLDIPTPRTKARATCAHCTLPVPAGLIDPSASEQFCCNGCKTAHSVISSCGLDGYYALVRASETPATPAKPSRSLYQEFDDAAFIKVHTTPNPGGTLSVELALENVHCAACVWLLEKLPSVLPGVHRATLTLSRGSLALEFDPAQVSLSRIARLIDSLGYPVHPAKDRSARDLRKREDRRHLIRIAIAGALTGNIMTFAFVLYGGLFVGIEPIYEQLFRWLSMALGMICLLGPGGVLLRSAWASIRARSLNLDVPICFALVSGGVMGLINTITQRGELYFDSLSMLVFLLLVGRFIQHRQQRWAGDSVELLLALTPSGAIRIREGQRDRVALETLEINDLVEVAAGDSIPVDGVIESGTSSVDASLLSGESRPVPARVGDNVFAGAVNITAPLTVRVVQTGRATRAGRLMQLVAEGASRRPPIIRFTDRVASWFVVGVSLVALATFILWLNLNSGRAIDQTTSLLIVTCPCALGLAAPLVMGVTMGRGARRGTLIKGADAIELLARPGVMILDKTGTVTQGRVSVVAHTCDARTLALAARLEQSSQHPVARAIFESADAIAIQSAAPATDINASRNGIAGLLDHQRIHIGPSEYLRAQAVAIAPLHADQAQQFLNQGLSPVLVAIDHRTVGVIAVGDALRPDSRDAITALRSRGWRIELLSGDDPVIVSRVGHDLGLPSATSTGGVSPEDKLARVKSLREQNPTLPIVMVGDGINDAAALAAASVGIAVHGGAEASLAAADVYLRRPGIAPVIELLDASRSSMNAVRTTLWASLAYNVFAGVLAIAGIIHPMIAAILMPVSSLTMLAIAIYWPRFNAPKEATT